MLAAGAAPSTETSVAAAQLAYVIYTSGSTGRPKGVMVTHEGLSRSTQARGHVYGARPATFLLVSPMTFDSAVAGLYWTLTTGATLRMATTDEQRDAMALLRVIAEAGVSHVLAVPTLYQALLEVPPRRTEALAVAIVAGEVCTPRLVAAHYARWPGTALVNEYGPTEATVWSTAYWCTPADSAAARIPIGRPVPYTRAYVVDAVGDLAPAGVPGELQVGGAGVARGYVQRPALTAARFVPDPWSPTPGARLYRTGDHTRWRDDGTLDYFGRADQQVKIRGYRIELGEIEEILRQHPIVDDLTVVAHGEAE